jgi:hypothetical protein
MDCEGNLLKADHINLKVVQDILPAETAESNAGDTA